jgi:hypothetical protein
LISDGASSTPARSIASGKKEKPPPAVASRSPLPTRVSCCACSSSGAAVSRGWRQATAPRGEGKLRCGSRGASRGAVRHFARHLEEDAVVTLQRLSASAERQSWERTPPSVLLSLAERSVRHALRVKAYDNRGAATTSAPVRITVRPK